MNTEQHGMANSYGLGELPDTGVRNGRLMPGRTAQLGMWAIVAAVMLCPLVS